MIYGIMKAPVILPVLFSWEAEDDIRTDFIRDLA